MIGDGVQRMYNNNATSTTTSTTGTLHSCTGCSLARTETLWGILERRQQWLNNKEE